MLKEENLMNDMVPQAETNDSLLTAHCSPVTTMRLRIRSAMTGFLPTSKKVAFTLAELLITLAIIGVVAALTIPTLMNKFQEYAIKNQFKKTYAVLIQAFKTFEYDFGHTPACYYWSKRPYDYAKCVERDEAGTCKRYELPNGDPLPSDYNGKWSGCKPFYESMKNILKVIKVCENKALENGCIPAYKGIDTVYKENNPDASDSDVGAKTSGCGKWRESAIYNDDEAWVLADGTIIFHFGKLNKSAPLFAVDVNGQKGPNMWGHDLFSFQLVSDGKSAARLTTGACFHVEKGGKSTEQMLKDMLN